MFHKIKLLFFFVAVGNCSILAQPSDFELDQWASKASFREKYENAQALFEDMQYFQASRIYKYLITEQPDNSNVNYRMGICMLNSSSSKPAALQYMEKAVKSVSKGYDPYNFAEKNAPIDAWFYLGRAYHFNYMLDKADEAYKKFIAEAAKKHILMDKAQLEVKHVENAKLMVQNKLPYIISNVGNVINGADDDFSPILSLDGNILYFTSRRLWPDSANLGIVNPADGMYFEDIYMSIKDRKGNWGIPIILEDFCEKDRHEATVSTSADGQTLFLYQDDNGIGNLYYTELIDTSFGKPLKIKGGEINTNAWETHCTLTPDGNTMYFVSDRKGGKGGRDIYRTTKLPNGEWSKALNMTELNTSYDEDSPFIAADGVTLYFSSNGPNSMGGFDIFKTRQIENEDGRKVWTNPENMGYPLNTVDDDVFFIQTADGKTGYYSSHHYVMNEDKNDIPNFGLKDIYMITFEKSDLEDIAVLKGFLNTSDGSPLPTGIDIYVYNLTDGTEPEHVRPDMRTNSYVLALLPCKDYRIDYQLNHKTFYETEVSVPCNAGYQEIHKEIFLNTLTLDGGEQLTNTVGAIDVSKLVRWKIVSSPKPIKGLSVVPIDDKGKPQSKVVISQNGTFEYERIPDQKQHIFEIESTDFGLCEEICIALVDSSDNVIGFAKRDKLCRFSYEMFEKKWQVMYKGKPYDVAGTKVTYLDENGNISFQDQLGCKGMFKYNELSTKKEQLFMIESDDPKLCEEMKIVLLDEKGNPIGETIRDAKCRFIYKRDADASVTVTAPAQAYFEKFYKYNQKGISKEVKEFEKFIDDIVLIIKVRGQAELEIESSASKVPTTTYVTNENLTKKRASEAKDRVYDALKKRNVDTSKLIVKAINTQVLGPEYNNDFQTNKDTYEKYQYVKIKVK